AAALSAELRGPRHRVPDARSDAVPRARSDITVGPVPCRNGIGGLVGSGALRGPKRVVRLADVGGTDGSTAATLGNRIRARRWSGTWACGRDLRSPHPSHLTRPPGQVLDGSATPTGGDAT